VSLAKFLIIKTVAIDFEVDATTKELWDIHEKHLIKFSSFKTKWDEGLELDDIGGNTSFLDLKIELGKRVMCNCAFCVRRCSVNRISGEKGYCRCSDDFTVSSYFPHMGEEPELVPSGTIFTHGCTIRCIHCQNWSISQWKESGFKVDPIRMSGIVGSLKAQRCRNINMVGGDPTPNTWLWLKTMKDVDVNIATVWNSNAYYSFETANLLAGFIDVYLMDFKYGNNDCSEAISDAPKYFEECTKNHIMAKEHGELIIRVLVLPEHNDCCTRPILEWISNKLGPWTRVNLMFQYRPEWKAQEKPDLGRRLTLEEMKEAKKIAKDVGLRNLVH
jgi:putative pyruvate formate lyase activating enzyme